MALSPVIPVTASDDLLLTCNTCDGSPVILVLDHSLVCHTCDGQLTPLTCQTCYITRSPVIPVLDHLLTCVITPVFYRREIVKIETYMYFNPESDRLLMNCKLGRSLAEFCTPLNTSSLSVSLLVCLSVSR